MFVSKTADLAVEFPKERLYRSVNRVCFSLERFYEGRRSCPELSTGCFLAKASQPVNHFLQINELSVQVFFANDAGKSKLVHLAKLSNMTKYFGVLQSLGHIACNLHARWAQIRFKQGGV